MLVYAQVLTVLLLLAGAALSLVYTLRARIATRPRRVPVRARRGEGPFNVPVRRH